MVKREQIKISAAETTQRNYIVDSDPESEPSEPEEDEEEETWSVMKERKDLKATADSTSKRDKRKTQFPSRYSVFALTTMRDSIMLKPDDPSAMEKFRMKMQDAKDELMEKKKLLLIRKQKDEPGADGWRKKRRSEALRMLGLNEDELNELLANRDDDWKHQSKMEALAILGVTEDECEIVYCDDSDMDEDTKKKLEKFTVQGKNNASITLMEQHSTELDEHGNPVYMIAGLTFSAFKKLGGLTPKMDPAERRRRKEFLKAEKKEKNPKKKFFKGKFRRRHSDSDSDDEGPPPVFKPYYHEDLMIKDAEKEKAEKESRENNYKALKGKYNLEEKAECEEPLD